MTKEELRETMLNHNASLMCDSANGDYWDVDEDVLLTVVNEIIKKEVKQKEDYRELYMHLLNGERNE